MREVSIEEYRKILKTPPYQVCWALTTVLRYLMWGCIVVENFFSRLYYKLDRLRDRMWKWFWPWYEKHG